MRIGILTLPLNTNYGGLLQAYALQSTLQEMGHEVVVLNQDRTTIQSPFKQFKSYGEYLVRRYLLGRNIIYKSPSILNQERSEREQYTQLFVNKNINTYKIKNLLNDVPENLDAIVVGSDQVWRHYYFTLSYRCGIENAFLKFCDDRTIRRIAYAASFGTDDWEYSEEETKECGRLLGKFDEVSVREAYAVKLCKEKLGRGDVRHVLDPTLLLTKDDYVKIVKNTVTPKSSGDLMCYLLDETEEKIKLVDTIASTRNLTPFNAGSKVEDLSASHLERIQPPVEEWLQGFMDAKFVVTDSFHACVFSILFNKPFVVIGNEFRGMSRFMSLLKLFSLEKNLIMNLSDYDDKCEYSVPATSYKKLAELKEKSISFLKENLS